MASVDSFAIELPPVPLQSFDPDNGMMPLFDEPMLGGYIVPSYTAVSSVDSVHSSPAGYSPTHAVPSPQPAEGTPGVTESSSDELAHGRSGIIDKLPNKKRMALLEADIKAEDDSAGSGPGVDDGAEGPDDDRTMKRQRRLMKNRESAQLSRQRKKVYVEELEKKVAQLQRSNDDLSKKNTVLTKDNMALREEVVRLAQQLRGGAPRPLSASKSAKAAGVCLLVVLFSFGIIFNSSQRLPFEDSLGTARARHIGRTLAQVEMRRTAKDADEEEMPAVANPSVAHIEVKADDVRQSTQADAKLRAPIKSNIANIGSIAERAAKLADPKEHRTIIGGDAKDRTSARLAVDSFDPTAFQELKRRKTAVKVFSDSAHHVTDDDTAVIQPVALQHKSQLVPAKNSDLVPLAPMEPYHVSLPIGAATRTRPITQYFFCPEAQRLTPTNGESPADMPPNYVALLIPGEMLNSTFAPANSLVEVTCSVASMNVYPNYRVPLPEHQDQAALQRVSGDDSE